MEHLTEMQRYKISWMLEKKYSKTQIASELGVSRSTIHRELRRNRNRNSKVYDPALAHEKYRKRMRDKPKRVRFSEEMRQLAREKLEKELWSPEQISGRCRLEGIDMVSHETLYRWIYNGRGRDSHLRDHLRHRGRKRQKRANRNDYRGLIPGRVDISMRPAVVNERSRPGDIEVDTVVGSGRSGAIVTFLWAELVPSLETCAVCSAVVRQLAPFKEILKTITFDNGREFSRHSEIADALGTDTFFTKPYHSWEKGSVENANGLLRQYFRKGSSFLKLSQDDIQRACRLINLRPRKRFGFRSPFEIFSVHLHHHFSQSFTPEVLRL